MQKNLDLFGPGSNPERRIVRDYGEISKRVGACRELGLTITLLAGTFDLFHEGHARYLELAKEYGNILIIGVDDDQKVRRRKGEGRPAVTVEDRMEILCHCRHVDIVFLKRDDDPKWHLIKTVRPDVLIATQETYNDEELRALKEFCGEVRVLPPQAAKSTTALIRLIVTRGGLAKIEHEFDAVVAHLKEVFRNLRGGE
ncbi:adenylyltransferase/cytidyltransferase family protein [Candidatus Parcubacteria bacterium]|nr:adenylyltransferase/cytidyltransferase family protein [Candidatus Parcubacteria bacterium]